MPWTTCLSTFIRIPYRPTNKSILTVQSIVTPPLALGLPPDLTGQLSTPKGGVAKGFDSRCTALQGSRRHEGWAQQSRFPDRYCVEVVLEHLAREVL